MGKTYYEILGVAKNADEVVIRAAYKALAQKYHPDKSMGNIRDAELMMAEFNKAYETLSNPLKRAAYDKSFNDPNFHPHDIYRNNEHSASSEEYKTQRPSKQPRVDDSLDSTFFKTLLLRTMLIMGGTFLAVWLYIIFKTNQGI